jgi:hypothetical protein
MHPRPTARANRTFTIIGGTIVAIAAVALIASCGDDDAAEADPVRFCEINNEIDELGDLDTATPADARVLVGRAQELLAEAEDVAPEEIRSGFHAIAESFREVLDFYADADYEVDPAALDAAAESGEVGVFWALPEADVVFGWIDENCDQP